MEIKRKSRKTEGFSLVELAVAAVILTIAIIPLLMLLNRSFQSVTYFGKSSVANQKGQELMEQILHMSMWDENSPPGKGIITANATAPGSLGPDGLETNASLYDDIDDFKGYISSDTYYECKVDVNYALIPNWTNPNDLVTVSTTNAQRTDFKKIDITCNWAGNTKQPIVLSTVAANISQY